MFKDMIEDNYYMIQAMRISGELPLDHHTRPNPLQGTKYLFDLFYSYNSKHKRNIENITGYMISKTNNKENHPWSDPGNVKGKTGSN